ncbi:hypothetical protein CANINC_002229 [Pichia inconspicua]|uniref:C2H2-type domain-containing protein n=1 Tax=Pichia inconspicua TaxID=52247 RepID=A0A4T0X1T3_9ASCO|nr:hypothetical protein CANINC_002229 [[Candida] inconspicua]
MNPLLQLHSSRASTNETEFVSLSTQPSALVNSPYDPRLFKTVDPTCITSIKTSSEMIPGTIPKVSIQNVKDHRNHSSNFLTEIEEQRKGNRDYYTTEIITDPQYFQDYLEENQNYYDDSNFSFDITSYELDSNPTPKSNNENINPIFFHHTPSPNNKTSIRVITASNRITKLRDKKLVQAIHRSLDLRRSTDDVEIFKTLNEHHSVSLKNDLLLSSPRKEINETFTNAIMQNYGKDVYNSPTIPLENYIFTSVTKQLNMEEFSDSEPQERNDSRKFPKTFGDIVNPDKLNQNIGLATIDIQEYQETLNQLQSEIAQFNNSKNLEDARTNKRKRDSALYTEFIDTTVSDDSEEEFLIKKHVKSGKRGRKPKRATKVKAKKPSEIPETDIVQRLFKESMKKNKDNFNRIKTTDMGLTTSKIAKLKVPRNASNIVREPTKSVISTYSDDVENIEKVPKDSHQKDIFECSECPKVFRQRSQWKRHVDCIHLKIAKFVCIKCNKAFKRSDHLKNHIRRIHAAAE